MGRNPTLTRDDRGARDGFRGHGEFEAVTAIDSSIDGGLTETTMSFGIYLVGYTILIAGLAIGAHLLHLPPKWIGVGVLCLIGLAIIHGVTATRQKDPPSAG